MRWLLAPYAERRTYLILLYLVLGLPLGVFEFTLMVTGFSLGLGLLITLLGIPVLIGTLLVAHALATFERRLAWSLLDAPMPALPLAGRGDRVLLGAAPLADHQPAHVEWRWRSSCSDCRRGSWTSRSR